MKMGTAAEVREWLLSPARVEAVDALTARGWSRNLLAAGAACDVFAFSNLCAEFVPYDVPTERRRAVSHFSDEALESLRLLTGHWGDEWATAPTGELFEMGLRLSPTPTRLRKSVHHGLSVLDGRGGWLWKPSSPAFGLGAPPILVAYPVNVNEPLHWTDVLPEVRDG